MESVQKFRSRRGNTIGMYSARETYTLIFDSPKGAGMAKDTSVTRVVVEELDLSRQRIKSYLFLRENSEWQA